MEFESYKIIKTTHGPAPVVKYATVNTEGAREKGNLLLPGRFLELCKSRIPCAAYYAGKKQLKGGKEWHDLHFMTNEDEEEKEAFFSDDDDDEDVIEIACKPCRKNNKQCFGFCGLCGNHQPEDGSQCVC